MWHAKDRAWLMIAAGVVAFSTFRVGVLAPPGGFWRHDEAGHHQAGTPVMLTLFPASYAWFTRFNAVAFNTSMLIMALLSSERFSGTWTGRTALLIMALLDMACLTGAVVFGSSPADPLAALRRFLVPVIIVVLIYSVALLTERRRAPPARPEVPVHAKQ